ncbi:MAG: hypothetical protein ACTHK7_19095, partial [Aureliella sp.]
MTNESHKPGYRGYATSPSPTLTDVATGKAACAVRQIGSVFSHAISPLYVRSLSVSRNNCNREAITCDSLGRQSEVDHAAST